MYKYTAICTCTGIHIPLDAISSWASLLPPTWRVASMQVPPTYMEGPWTSERIISFYVAEKKKYFGTLANEVVW